MAETTNKVNPDVENAGQTAEGNGQPTEGAKDAKKENARKDFVIKDALYKQEDGQIVSAANADGLLIAVPKPLKDETGKIVYAGFNLRKHNPLKKGNFANIATFMQHRAFVSRVRAAILVKTAEELESKAARIAKFGDEETRKKVQRMARMKEQLAALEQQLKEDGVDTTDI